ncbi:hypothetical protein [Nostoc sp.]|uniref:hypothetical protein n=1 Tax=Nostoc sp. TaxID=1180 RepID=UPI002FF9B1D5
MTQDSPDRLDRIEATLDKQLQVNADLRVTAEALLQTVQNCISLFRRIFAFTTSKAIE